jgi:hypothetical protein
MKLNPKMALTHCDPFEIVYHYRQKLSNKRRKMLRNQNYRRKKEIFARSYGNQVGWDDY